MMQWKLLMFFLYFPEDKTEYFPAAISFTIFLIGAIVTMRFIIKKSRQEEKKAKELEERLLNQNITEK